MTTEQREWCEAVTTEVLKLSNEKPKMYSPPFIDLAIFHKMGMSPKATAKAILGMSRGEFNHAVSIAREEGTMPPKPTREEK